MRWRHGMSNSIARLLIRPRNSNHHWTNVLHQMYITEMWHSKHSKQIHHRWMNERPQLVLSCKIEKGNDFWANVYIEICGYRQIFTYRSMINHWRNSISKAIRYHWTIPKDFENNTECNSMSWDICHRTSEKETIKKRMYHLRLHQKCSKSQRHCWHPTWRRLHWTM